MRKYSTIEVVKNIMGNHKLRYTTVIDGKVKTAFYNQNGGISVDRKSTLILGGKMLNALWEEVQTDFTFIEAVNSDKWIKHKSWGNYKPIQDSLYDLLDYPVKEVIRLINGEWHIKGGE